MTEPDFEIITSDQVSWVHGTVNGVEVTRASFKECDEPFRRELVQIDTPPEHRRNGFALALLRFLANARPHGPLINSPTGMNTDEGIATIDAARLHGIAVHEFGCFRNGLGCECALGVQSP